MDDDTPGRVFCKTTAGRAALAGRALVGPQRTALILVNGRDSMRTLRTKLGPDTVALVEELQRRGLAELRPSPRDLLPAAPGSAAPSPPSTPAPDESARLEPLKREALTRLGTHFGPDATIVAAALLQATHAAAYNAALCKIEGRLALYLGKRRAAQVLAGLRG